jgi:hypothetical protein
MENYAQPTDATLRQISGAESTTPQNISFGQRQCYGTVHNDDSGGVAATP